MCVYGHKYTHTHKNAFQFLMKMTCFGVAPDFYSDLEKGFFSLKTYNKRSTWPKCIVTRNKDSESGTSFITCD